MVVLPVRRLPLQGRADAAAVAAADAQLRCLLPPVQARCVVLVVQLRQLHRLRRRVRELPAPAGLHPGLPVAVLPVHRGVHVHEHVVVLPVHRLRDQGQPDAASVATSHPELPELLPSVQARDLVQVVQLRLLRPL